MSPREAATGWHLDKKVPLGLILVIVSQAIFGVAYINRMEARFDQRLALLEADGRTLHESDTAQQRDRSSEVATLAARLDRMESKLDRLIERERR